jgi:heme oxygenase
VRHNRRHGLRVPRENNHSRRILYKKACNRYDQGMSSEQTSNTPGRDPFLVRLKTETRSNHNRTESAVDLQRQLQSLAGYQGMLARFYGLYQPLEELLKTEPAFPSNERPRLIKTGLLERDLAVLGMTSQELAALPVCRDLPLIDTAAASYGCLYVLEGATLGGQIVRREVAQRFPSLGETICRFFNPYESQTGRMWTDFCSDLSSFVAAQRATEDAIIAAAKATFACFERWLQKNP